MVWISERSQESFLVGIENRHQGNLRNIQPFAQEIDADQHIELAQTQIADDFNALDGIDVRMQVTHAHAVLTQIIGQFLGHALGQRRHQNALLTRGALADFAEQVVHL